MEFLFSTGSLWSYSIERCFDLAAKAGFDGLEVLVDHRWETRQPFYLEELVKRFGLRVKAFHTPFLPQVPGWPREQPERILRTLELATALGAEIVVHHLPLKIGSLVLQTWLRDFRLPVPYNPDAAYRDWLENDYHRLQEQNKIKMCIENLPAYRRFGRRWNIAYWNNAEDMRRFDHITLDTTHLGTRGIDPLDFYQRVANRVAHVHLSNFDGREHILPEEGQLRLDLFLAALATEGYQGHVTLELHPEALAAGQQDEMIVGRLTRSLNFCRKSAYFPQTPGSTDAPSGTAVEK